VKKSRIRVSPQDWLSIFPFLVFVLAGLSAVYPRFSVFFDSAAWCRSQSNFYLEAQKWSESYPQIVVRAVVKVHFIATSSRRPTGPIRPRTPPPG
jgi:hypothetical protein